MAVADQLYVCSSFIISERYCTTGIILEDIEKQDVKYRDKQVELKQTRLGIYYAENERHNNLDSNSPIQE
jgi:hypothetical protein